MKKNLLMTAALAAMMIFASCSKNNDAMPVDDGTKAYLNVSVNAPVTKATGTAKPTDNVINDFTAFVAYADGSLVSGYSSDGSALTGANAILVSKNLAEGQHVYVVANAGDLTAIDELDDLETYIANLNLPNGGQQEATKVWATGKTPEGLLFIQSGNEFVAQAPVTVTFVAARITLTITDEMDPAYDAANENDDLVLKKVAVLNARGASHLFGSSLIPADGDLVSPAFAGTKFYSGIDGTGFSNYPAPAIVTPNVSSLADDIPANDFSKIYHYYVFENDAVTAVAFPTIVTLTGTFDGEPVYFPVHLAPYEQFATGTITNGLERGKSYDITIRLTVDPGNPGGSDDPTDPLITAKVEVSVTISDWTAVTLEKEF